MARFPRYAPQYRITIDGDEIPPALRGSIISVKLTSALKGANRVDLSIANQGYRWTDHALLQTKLDFSLQLGYAPDPLVQMFAGKIVTVDSTFPQSGIPIMTVSAQDAVQPLMQNRHDESHRTTIPFIGNFPLPDEAVIATVLKGLQPQIDPVGGALSLLSTLASYLVAPEIAQKAVRIQESVSDFEFLSKIAKDNGWEMFIDHSQPPYGFVLQFKSLVEDFVPALTLKAGASLKDFNPRLTSVGDVDGVSARIWVDSLKMEFVIVLTWDFERASFDLRVIPGALGDIAELLGLGGAANTIDLKPASFGTAVQEVFNEMLPRLNARQTGSGTTVGDPRIRPGEIINLDGVGQQFGGLYRVESAEHNLGSDGYTTHFTVRKEAWFGATPLPQGIQGAARAIGQAA